jgi:hypothetical protein
MQRIIKNALVSVLSCSMILSSCSKKESVVLRFHNPLQIDRNYEVVTMRYNEFTNQAGDLPVGKIPLFIDRDDTLISQNIDLNNDGIPEEILVEISIKASGNKDIRVEYVEASSFPAFPIKTNLHFASLNTPQKEIDSASRLQTIDTKVTASIFQLEGPAWENDKVAFRNYYDLRNGMDIFGKKPGMMAMDTIGLGAHSYHLMSSWGMDILKVANSLGAGAIGMEKDKKLYRIGDNGLSGFERIYEGPLKSEFAFRFNNWTACNDSFEIIQYVSITAGLYCYESEVFAGFPDDSYNLIAGIVNKYSDRVLFDNAGENHVLLGTHSIQSEDTSALGMAILIPRNLYKSHDESPQTGAGITETYFARISTSMSDPAHYYFYAGWATGNSTFTEKENFVSLIKEDALKMENPIRIKKIILP